MSDSTCDPYGCPTCAAVVFIPRSAGVTGGVCTQQARGCKGELVKLGDVAAQTVRDKLAARGHREQPWLTLVFQVPRG